MYDIQNIPYSPIINHKYSEWFKSLYHNGKVLTDTERKQFGVIVDSIIDEYCDGFPLMEEALSLESDFQDDYRTLHSVILFITITLIDSFVAIKYFILADRDYERRFMRGKLLVILNEGFKKLYGFEKTTKKKSEWSRLRPLMPSFPEIIQRQYDELSALLENHASSSSWWRDERNYETHIEAENLYLSRKKELNESQVMIDSLKLINTLLAVFAFLGNVHSCILNASLRQYFSGSK